ncbi:MAG TPA: hypothetical protein VGP26_27750 [Actinophytocola sp.]|jgi:hypothetical protein|nr:hypothetical protein [Actinophytocola sp.]
MPKARAREREDEVLSLVCAALTTPERSVTLETRPDQDPASNLTVDALLRVSEDESNELWAADVCLASRKFDPRLPAAMRAFRQDLLPLLNGLAGKVGRCVSVSCRAYVRLPGVSRNEWKPMVRSYMRNVVDRVAVAAMRPDQEWFDSEVGIRWRPAERWENGDRVMLQFYEPFMHEGFKFSRAVHLKLSNQLQRAGKDGYPTILILDQKPPDYVDWIMDIVPDPGELGEMLGFLVASQRATLSAGLLVDANDSVHEIYYRVGRRDLCGQCGSQFTPGWRRLG